MGTYVHHAPVNSCQPPAPHSFWKRVFHKIQTTNREIPQIGGGFKADAFPSRPPNHTEGSNHSDEIDDRWTNNDRESDLGFPSDEKFLADAFGDFELDKCAPRAIIEELDEFELELVM